MAKLTALVFVLLLLAGTLLPGCSKSEMLDVYGDLVSAAGNIGLSSSLSLKGEREFGADKYTGTYRADYEDFSGEECPFGGTMLERRTQEHVEVTCTITRDTGTARLTWNSGADGVVTLADKAGEHTQTIYLAPGSNYFNLTFDHFSGRVELTIE